MSKGEENMDGFTWIRRFCLLLPTQLNTLSNLDPRVFKVWSLGKG